MMGDKIDIHGIESKYEGLVRKLASCRNMNERNRELILRFTLECKVGKTVHGRARKKIGKLTIIKYIYSLRTISSWLGKPFDEVSQEEMEKLVTDIEEDVYRKANGNFCEETKIDFKRTLKKFYRWLGKPELVEFIDMSIKPRDVPAITREEAEMLINSTPEALIKAAIMALFDGGARAEEFLNIRLKDLTMKKYDNDNECFWINIRHSKTKARNIPLPLCTKYLNKWITEHPEKNNPEAQLFPIKYKSLNRQINGLAQKVLKKRVTAHILRHSSATYWAPKLNRYQLCAKYGWAFSSPMPDRYIERKGIIFDEVAEKGDTDQTTKLQKENRALNDKIETLEQEYAKVRKALESLMPILDDEEIKKRIMPGLKAHPSSSGADEPASSS